MKLFKVVALLGMFVAGSASAALLDVKKIRVTSYETSGTNAYIQLAELIALDTSNSDVALQSAGATVTGTAVWSSAPNSFSLDHVIDGSLVQSTLDGYFHSNASDFGTAFVEVTLAAATTLQEIILVGRTSCCSVRDVFNIEIFDSAGASIFSMNQLDANNAQNRASVQFVSAPSALALLLAGAGLVMVRRKKA